MNPSISKRFSHSFKLAVLLVILINLPGCALRGTLSAWKPAPKDQSFQISYTLQNASRELDPWSSFSERGLQTASWSSQNLATPSGNKPAELKIEFPHPTSNPETALVTLSVFAQPFNPEEFQPPTSRHWMSRLWPKGATNQDEIVRPIPDEVITLELSHAEFEQLMSELNREQYLDENTKDTSPQMPATLSISRNEHQIHSTREAAPQLNELIRRTYLHGTQILGTHHGSGPSVLQTSGLTAPSPLVVE